MPSKLSQLVVYPIKSTKGISLTSSRVEESGLWGDRRYMLIDESGEFLTGRSQPRLPLTSITYDHNALVASHPDMAESVAIINNQFSDEHIEVRIWDHSTLAQVANDTVNHWFSQLLGIKARLVYFTEQSNRFTKRRPSVPVAFSDGYPFLLTTEASLRELNASCPEDISMARFRPNLVINNDAAFEEDSWKRIRIGEVEFENVKPCERCIFTTLDPTTSQRSKKGEPLKTLAKFRLLDKTCITFGINMIALNTGTIRLGDEIEIIEYKEPEIYNDKRKSK